MRKALASDCRSAMSDKVVLIENGTTVQDAASLLLKHQVSRLPVVDSLQSLVGIITTTDIMQIVVADADGYLLRD